MGETRRGREAEGGLSRISADPWIHDDLRRFPAPQCPFLLVFPPPKNLTFSSQKILSQTNSKDKCPGGEIQWIQTFSSVSLDFIVVKDVLQFRYISFPCIIADLVKNVVNFLAESRYPRPKSKLSAPHAPTGCILVQIILFLAHFEIVYFKHFPDMYLNHWPPFRCWSGSLHIL